MEKQKIKAVVDTGRTWTSKEGKTFKISTVTLEDGRVGETMSEKFKAGEDANLIVTEKEWQGKKSLSFKYVPEQGTFGGGAKRGSNESFALSYAKDCYVALQDKIPAMSLNQMFSLADQMLEWLNKNKQ